MSNIKRSFDWHFHLIQKIMKTKRLEVVTIVI